MREKKALSGGNRIEKRVGELRKKKSALGYNFEYIPDFFDTRKDIFILIDEQGIVIDANLSASESLHVSRDELIGSCVWSHFPPQFSKPAKEQTDKVFLSGKPVRYEDKIAQAWYDVVFHPVFNAGKKPDKAAILARDITTQKQVEGLFRFQQDLSIVLSSPLELGEMFSRVLDEIVRIDGIDAAGICVLQDSTGNMEMIVHQGLSDDFIRSISSHDPGAPQVRLIMEGKPLYLSYREAWEEGLATAGSEDFRSVAIIPIKAKDRVVASLNLVSNDLEELSVYARIAFETAADRIGSVIGRKSAEELLHKYELIISTVHSPMSYIDRNYTYQAVNKAYQSAFNKPREAFIGHSIAEIFGKDVFAEKMKKCFDEALEGKEIHYEGWFDYPGSGRRYTIISYYPFRESDGSISGIATISRDITERKKAEELLMESEARHRNLFESASDPIVIMKDNDIDDCNKKTLEVFRCTAREIFSVPFNRFFPPAQSDGEESSRKWDRLFQAALTEKPQFFEWTFVRGNGSRFEAEVSLNPFELKGEYYVQAIIRDITERKIKEEENIKVSKLESISTLAGGIAHDFNNLLATIMGNVELAQFHTNPDHPSYRRLEKAINACNRSRDLIRQFLTLSKGGIPVKKTSSLVPLITDSATLALTGSKIPCSFDISDKLWMVEFDEGQIMHALHNIIMNAREAMPGGGKIAISAKNAMIGPDGIEHGRFIKQGLYVVIDIRDRGVGIPEENREKIFDPYFSTKGKGTQKGMGLGLTTAYSIIKKHGGYIVVDSTVGKGTVFHIYLPATLQKAEHREASRPPERTAQSPILTMDDEEMIREAAKDILEHLGYQVESSKNGEEAIEKFVQAKRAGRGFGVVILDLDVRSGMGGAETMKRLKEIDPGVIGIVSSGQTDNSIMANYKNLGFSAVVAKPYTADELRVVLRKLFMR